MYQHYFRNQYWHLVPLLIPSVREYWERIMGHPVVLRVLTKKGDYLIAVGVDALLLLGPRVHPLLAALQREVATKVLEKYVQIYM